MEDAIFAAQEGFAPSQIIPEVIARQFTIVCSVVTIKDVAKRAGVSIATVSRIINGADNVGEQYRIAVRKAIEELEYQPNVVAQSMKKRAFRTIGVIMSDFSVPFFEKILKKIEKAYRKKGNLVLPGTFPPVYQHIPTETNDF